MRELLLFFGPKATLPIVALMFLIAPVAIWHHIHVIILVVRWFREGNHKEASEGEE